VAAEIMRPIAGGDAPDAIYPTLQPTVMGVNVVERENALGLTAFSI
jgi:hypothetical protein